MASVHRWSPEQISRLLPALFPDRPEVRVAPETGRMIPGPSSVNEERQGAPRIAWPPTRRQRIPGSPAISTHSKVARPSGPEKLHVISQTPGAPWTAFTSSEDGHAAAGSSERRSQAGWNSSLTTRWKVARSAFERRA